MRRKNAAGGALVLGTALLGWWSCSDGESADGKNDAGKDAGGTAGSGATGGTGGASTGGTGATGGSSGAAGWGAYPKWEATPDVAAGCPIKRLTNASELWIFKWEPCSWSPADCEQAVLNPTLFGTDGGFYPSSTVHDDGESVRVGLALQVKKNTALFAKESGLGLDGIGTTGSSDNCMLAGASVWGLRFGVVLGAPSVKSFGGVVGQLGSAVGLGALTLTNPPPGVSQSYVLGSSRWVWWWAPTYSYTSVSALDGSDYVQFANTAQPSPLLYLGKPVTTGKTFLFQTFVGDDAGTGHGKIMWSDGLAAPQDYLEPADPDDDFGEPLYANTHVAFMRGVQRKDINVYDSTELWASPYSDDPSKLAPSLVGKLPYQSMSDGVGGWSRIATPSPGTGGIHFAVRHLGAGTEQTFFLPEDHDFRGFLGMSRTRLWIGAGKVGIGGAPYLVRYLLK